MSSLVGCLLQIIQILNQQTVALLLPKEKFLGFFAALNQVAEGWGLRWLDEVNSLTAAPPGAPSLD